MVDEGTAQDSRCHDTQVDVHWTDPDMNGHAHAIFIPDRRGLRSAIDEEGQDRQTRLGRRSREGNAARCHWRGFQGRHRANSNLLTYASIQRRPRHQGPCRRSCGRRRRPRHLLALKWYIRGWMTADRAHTPVIPWPCSHLFFHAPPCTHPSTPPRVFPSFSSFLLFLLPSSSSFHFLPCASPLPLPPRAPSLASLEDRRARHERGSTNHSIGQGLVTQGIHETAAACAIVSVRRVMIRKE